MSKVYVVEIYWYPEGHEITGVFSSEEKAIESIKSYDPKEISYSEIIEFEVQ